MAQPTQAEVDAFYSKNYIKVSITFCFGRD
jgi:hypothetical protein